MAGLLDVDNGGSRLKSGDVIVTKGHKHLGKEVPDSICWWRGATALSRAGRKRVLKRFRVVTIVGVYEGFESPYCHRGPIDNMQACPVCAKKCKMRLVWHSTRH
eukprot:707051-Amphidinium_carterae.1